MASGTELKFGPRGAVLLGRNGTGKTTLLDILVKICRLDFGSLSDGDYDIEFSMACADDVELHVTATSEKADASLSPEPASLPVADAVLSLLQERARRQTFRIEALHPGSGERALLESNDHEVRYNFPNGQHLVVPFSASDSQIILLLASQKAGKNASLRGAFYELLRLHNALRRFDEGLDYFRDLTERSPNSARMELTRSSDGDYIITPLDTSLISYSSAHRLLRDFERNQDRSSSGFSDSSEIKYLESFCRLADFDRARIGVDLDEKRQAEGREEVSLSPLRFELRRNGSVLHHRHLSFGQRRLLAFLHYHDSTPTLLVADELVNGMHHEWIAECVHLMRDSQAFLSSQNPLLFDFLTFESAEDVASRFVTCDLDEQHRFVWRNMSDSDASEFYETHKAGLQHASEILRTRGYW